MIRGKERKNYLAYSWRDKYANQCLLVDYFTLPTPPFSEARIRRALEAELTFQVRVATGMWPKEMSEIHFLEELREYSPVVEAAKEILGTYGIPYQEQI